MGRISALTELTTLASDDYLVVLDSSANIAKKITIANAFGIPDFGFTATGESWTYASATTITVPTDATTKYAKGNIVKFTQATGGTKYAVITTVAATLLTVVMLDGATLVNEAITSPFYSNVATPLGSGQIRYDQLGTDSSHAWKSYTPSYTNVTIGNGTVTAKYIQIGKTVFVRFHLVFGTTTAISGDIQLGLPVTAFSYPGTAALPPLGTIRCYDVSGGAVYNGDASWISTTRSSLRSFNSAGTYSVQTVNSSTVPFTWANTDELHASLVYEAA